jgi:hypothetical protein
MPGSRAGFKRPRLPLLIGGGVVLVLILAAIVGLVVTQAAPPQPFPYNHAVHIEQGIPCLYCHPGAYRTPSAGLPTRAKCLGCHNNIKADTPELQQFDEYAKSHENFEWVPVALMPDFVYFSHQPHISANIDCVTCHGDLSQMSAAEPQNNWNMGWCLDCHKKMAPEKQAKLFDCATCHQ